MTALIRHHAEDQYRRDAAPVEVILRGVPFAGRPFRIGHYRIDDRFSNSHSAWMAEGSPQNPRQAQLDAIRSRSGLEVCEPDRRLEQAPAAFTMQFVLPLPGVSLLELEAQ